jgi:hypothetical protein
MSTDAFGESKDDRRKQQQMIFITNTVEAIMDIAFFTTAGGNVTAHITLASYCFL